MMKGKRLRRILAIAAALIAALYVVLLIGDAGYVPPMDAKDMDTTRHETVAVFGATGTVGDGLLKAALDDPDVTTVHVITRRPSPRIEEGVAAGKAIMTIHKDYLDYSAIREVLADVDAVYWAIGLSAVGLDEDTYREIHVDYPVNLAKEWLAVSEKANVTFHYISGGGASADSRMMWARVKARAESDLEELAEGTKLRAISYRPAFVTPTEAELNIGHKVLHGIFAPIGMAVRAASIGKAMLEISARGPEVGNGTILENRDIVSYGKAHEARR